MDLISERVRSLSPSATLVMLQKTNELKAAGVDVIGMAAGEPDFNTPAHIKEAAVKAIEDNFSHYSPVPGYLSLRKAISDKLLRENGLEFPPSSVIVGNGAKHELANTIMALVNPGDEVIIPIPAWVSYVEMVKLAGGVPVTVPTDPDNDFRLMPEDLRDAITPRTRLLMLNSPSNPTGAIYRREDLDRIAAVLREHPGITVLSDEIYEHINFVGGVESIASCEGMEGRVVIVNGVSKAYAMTGWRIGFLAAPAEIAAAVNKLQGQYTSGPSSIAQKAAEAAYTGPQECVAEMREAFQRRRDLICDLASEIDGWKFYRPDGAFYLFPEVKALLGKRAGDRVINTSADYVMYLLEEANVACVDGAAFCAPGFIRLSYATSDDNIREAMRRIKEATGKLQ